jgi:ABC-type transport system involved in cytochrome bd biosynthesis fused ATPase/permease subunit
VHFSDPNSEAGVLNGVSFRVAPGEHVAVIDRAKLLVDA